MLFIYQLKVGLCLIAFYLLLKLLLSRETLHRVYRLSLLSAVVLSVLLPLLHVSLPQPSALGQGLVYVEGIIAEAQPSATAAAQTMSWSWLVSCAYIIYIVGIVAALLWQVLSHWRLHQLLRQGSTRRLADGTWLHVVPGSVSPFSFFRHIVISEQDYHDNPREILTHEQAHIHLHHSLDVLLLNVLVALQWWNPAAWLLRRELMLVHEYEADEAVLQRGVDARQYQLLLIRKSVGNQLFSMANNLNHQSLKKRIRMMTRKRSSRWQQLRLLAVVPVAGLALVAFAQPEVRDLEDRVEQAVQPEAATAADSGWRARTLPLDPRSLEATDTTKVYDMVEVMPMFPGGPDALMKYLYEVLRYPQDAEQAQKEGRVIVTFVVDEEGWVREPKVMRSVYPSLDNEALRVVSAMPKWEPGRHKGQAVRVKYTMPIHFRLAGKPAKTAMSPEKTLVVVDGQRVPAERLQQMDPKTIDRIDVLKDAASLAKYDAQGYEGVVLVTTKKQ